MWLEAGLLILLLLLQAGSLALFWYQGRRWRRDLSAQANPGGGVHALLLTNALNRIEHRLDAMNEHLRALDAHSRGTTRPAALPVAPVQLAASHNYELAQQLAREGVSLDALMERCGLSRNEAELVQRLYAGRT